MQVWTRTKFLRNKQCWPGAAVTYISRGHHWCPARNYGG